MPQMPPFRWGGMAGTHDFGAKLSHGKPVAAEAVRGSTVSLPSLEFQRLAAELRPAWLVHTKSQFGKQRYAFSHDGWVFTTLSSDPLHVPGARLIEAERFE